MIITEDMSWKDVQKRFKMKHVKREYDYTECIYIDLDTTIDIRHVELGVFTMTPREHFYLGHPGRTTNPDRWEVYKKQNTEKYKGEYSYPDQDYRDSRDKIIACCEKHGEFGKVGNTHSFSQGCPDCNYENRRVNRAQLITDCRAKHNDAYLYCLLPPNVCIKDKAWIICKKHGLFEQRLEDHLRGHVGCADCVSERTPPKEPKIIGLYTRTVCIQGFELQVYTVGEIEYLLRREVAIALGHNQISHVFDHIQDAEKDKFSINITEGNPHTSMITPLGMAQAVYATRKIAVGETGNYVQDIIDVFPQVIQKDVTDFVQRLKGIKDVIFLEGCAVEVYNIDNQPYILLNSLKEWLGYSARTQKGYMTNTLKQAISEENKRVEYASIVSGSYLTTFVNLRGVLESLAYSTKLTPKQKYDKYSILTNSCTWEDLPPLEDYLLPGDIPQGHVTLFGVELRYVVSPIGSVFSVKEVAVALHLNSNINYNDKQEGEHILLKTSNNATVGNQLYVTPLVVAQKIQHSRKFPATQKQEALTILSKTFDTPFDFVCRTFKETDFIWDLHIRINSINTLYTTAYKLEKQYAVKKYKIDGLIVLEQQTLVIEFDENYHVNQPAKDKKRMREILKELQAQNLSTNYEVIRVPEDEADVYKEKIISNIYTEIINKKLKNSSKEQGEPNERNTISNN